jgi:hypothetical protein
VLLLVAAITLRRAPAVIEPALVPLVD